VTHLRQIMLNSPWLKSAIDAVRSWSVATTPWEPFAVTFARSSTLPLTPES
jgi:hypothetical protein